MVLVPIVVFTARGPRVLHNVSPDMVESRKYFKVVDVSGNTRDKQGQVARGVRYYECPSTYYDFMNQKPARPMTSDEWNDFDETAYNEQMAAWKAARDAFVEAHADWSTRTSVP